MKKLLRSLLLSSLLFNAANSQTDFLWQKEFKVNYEGRSYLSKEYKEKDEKRKFAYYIYELDKNNEAMNLIGDDASEFRAYRGIALASNYFSDRGGMRQDISRIKDLFSEANKYYQLNKIIHSLTGNLIRFGVGVGKGLELNKEELRDKVNEEYTSQFKEFGKRTGEEIKGGYIKGDLKNWNDLKKILKERIFDKTVSTTQDVLTELEACKNFLEELEQVNSSRILKFRSRLHTALYRGYENYAIQKAWILFVNDPLNKIEYIASESINSGLESFNERLNIYIEAEVRSVLNKLQQEISLEENEFNLRDSNSNAYKLIMELLNSGKIEFSVTNMTDCGFCNLNGGNLEVVINTCEKIPRFGKVNAIKIDLKDKDFKRIGRDAEISFDIKARDFSDSSFYVGFVDYLETRTADEGQSEAKVIFGPSIEKSSKVILKINYKEERVNVICKDNKGRDLEESSFSLSRLREWRFRMIPQEVYYENSNEQKSVRLNIKDFKIKFE